MIGEYYVVTQSSGDQYLYVIPAVYNKISSDNPFTPVNGQIVQMYAQIEGLAPGDTLSTPEEDRTLYYESWACNLKYFTDVTDITKDRMIEVAHYRGNKLLSSQRGTYQSANAAEQVSTSAWRNDPELSLIRESNENAVGDKYMIYQCGMYRQFDDDFSTVNLKIGDEIGWVYGYRVYKRLGSYEVDIQDDGEGFVRLIESTSGAIQLFTTCSSIIAATLAMFAF